MTTTTVDRTAPVGHPASDYGLSLPAEVGLLFRRRLRQAWRAPMWIFAGMATPLLYLVLFVPLLRSLPTGLWGGAGAAQMFMPGMLVMLAFSAGSGIGWTILHELDGGVIERLRVTPVRRVSLLLGTELRDALMCVVPAAVVAAVSMAFGFTVHLAGALLMLVLLALVAMALSAVSTAVALLVKQIGTLAAIISGVQVPLMLLSGVLLPVSLGPTWLKVLAHANPLYYAVEASRDLALGRITTGTVGLGFLVTAVATALAVTWGTRVLQKAVA